MRAELYLFQQESPDKALAEYASIEQEFPESEHAAKAGLAIAWVTSFTLGDTAAAMEKYADYSQKQPQITYKSARYASRHLWFDCRKAHDQLGMPRTPLRETIESSIRWFRANGYA